MTKIPIESLLVHEELPRRAVLDQFAKEAEEAIAAVIDPYDKARIAEAYSAMTALAQILAHLDQHRQNDELGADCVQMQIGVSSGLAINELMLMTGNVHVEGDDSTN